MEELKLGLPKKQILVVGRPVIKVGRVEVRVIHARCQVTLICN